MRSFLIIYDYFCIMRQHADRLRFRQSVSDTILYNKKTCMRHIITMLFLLAVSILPAMSQDFDKFAVHSEDTDPDMDNPTFEPLLRIGKVADGKDSIQFVSVNPIWIYPDVPMSAGQRAKYNRLVANIKKVLPIAKEVNTLVLETYEVLERLPNKKAKDAHMKIVEKAIKKEYTPRMKKLTYAQGKLLIKLVYRECNSSSYQLVKAFLGPVKAGFYQAFAWTFGASLTKKYDPNGVDRLTERIVRQVEAGQI